MGTVYNPPKEIGDPPKFKMETWRKDESTWLKKLKKWVTSRHKGEYAGEILRIPYADGYAEYMVMSLKPVKLIHIPLGDAWQFPYAERLQSNDIKAAIDTEKAMNAVFAEKRRQPASCPYCGSKDLSVDMVEWNANSTDPTDLDNCAVLKEHQCNACNRSFWT